VRRVVSVHAVIAIVTVAPLGSSATTTDCCELRSTILRLG